jgi:hypothetical protein
MRSTILRLAASAAIIGAAAPAAASASLNVSGGRIGAQPGVTRVVVDMTGATFQLNEADATDPSPADGRGRVEIRHAAIAVRAFDLAGHGVRMRVSRPGSGRAAIVLTSAPGAFKYLRLSGLHNPERLVLDLYRSTPPAAAAEIRSAPNGCLALRSVQRSGRAFVVGGVERNVFEGSFQLIVRDARGRVVGRRTITARGAWRKGVGYRGVSGPQAGTIEAVASSAKDGSLACLVQRRVALVA